MYTMFTSKSRFALQLQQQTQVSLSSIAEHEMDETRELEGKLFMIAESSLRPFA